MAAANLSCVGSLGRFDIYLYAKVGDHQALLFGAQIAADQAFFGHIGPATGADGALVLNFLNTPVLASGEVSLGHVVH